MGTPIGETNENLWSGPATFTKFFLVFFFISVRVTISFVQGFPISADTSFFIAYGIFKEFFWGQLLKIWHVHVHRA